MEIPALYKRRFVDSEFRKDMWRVLCHDFFQRLVPADATVVEVACGHCEFINAIQAKQKIGIDINPDARLHADSDVDVRVMPSTEMQQLGSDMADVVFMSNFLEHITREDIDKTLRECHRVLKPGGRLIILQPNIRFLANDYWMFIDHITPVDDRALVELLAVIGFHSITSKPRFLPYTTQGRLPNSITLLRLYLKLTPLHWLLGKQALVIAAK